MIFKEFPMKFKHLIAGVAVTLLAASAFAGAEQGEAFVVVEKGIVHDALYDICFSSSDGLAVGYDGLLLESSNAGQNWEKVSSELLTSVTLLGAYCDDSKRIVVGQEGHMFMKTESSWKAVDSGSEQRLLAVDMNRQGLAVVVGGFGTVLRSRDSGESWETLEFDWEAVLGDFLEPHLYDVVVDEAGVITLIGEFELILRSADGGDTWQTIHKGESTLFSLFLLDSGVGFAVGQKQKILKTVDGGATWESVGPTATADAPNLLSVWSSTQGEVVITGMRAMLRSSDSGLSWRAAEMGDVAINWYQALAATLSSEETDQGGMDWEQVYMVGHSGRIVRLTQE